MSQLVHHFATLREVKVHYVTAGTGTRRSSCCMVIRGWTSHTDQRSSHPLLPVSLRLPACFGTKTVPSRKVREPSMRSYVCSGPE
jgi:hypothetical protein